MGIEISELDTWNAFLLFNSIYDIQPLLQSIEALTSLFRSAITSYSQLEVQLFYCHSLLRRSITQGYSYNCPLITAIARAPIWPNRSTHHRPTHKSLNTKRANRSTHKSRRTNRSTHKSRHTNRSAQIA